MPVTMLFFLSILISVAEISNSSALIFELNNTKLKKNKILINNLFLISLY